MLFAWWTNRSLKFSISQWHSQDEQVTWAQHGLKYSMDKLSTVHVYVVGRSEGMFSQEALLGYVGIQMNVIVLIHKDC